MVQEKKMIDEVCGWLKLYEDGSVDRTWSGPPQFKFMSDAVPPHLHFVDGVSVTDTTTPAGLKIRIYLPEISGDANVPILLHFHGGGFCISEANWYMYYAPYSRLARDAGSAVVSVHLRHAPEHKLPAACDDGLAALLWLQSVATGDSPRPLQLRTADFRRVFLVGDSSGGNIVHQVAVQAGRRDLSPLRIAGAIPIHPGFCRSRRSRSEMERPETPFLTLEMVDKFLGFALPVGATKDHPITCPMGEALEGEKVPPYLYCLAGQDLLWDTEMEFYEAMRGAKKEIELFVNDGVGHSFYLNKVAVDSDAVTGEETRKLFQRIAQFVSQH